MGKLNYQQLFGDLALRGYSVQYKTVEVGTRAIILLIRLYSVINEVVTRNQRKCDGET